MKSQFDPDDNNEYLVFDSNPTSSSSRSLGTKAYRFKKREFSDLEVAGAGLLAGATVEVARTIVTYPLDTLRTRLQLQSDPGLAREVAHALLAAALNTSLGGGEGLEPVAQASDAHAASPMQASDAHTVAAVAPMHAVAVAPGRAAALGSWWEGLWEGLGTALLSSPPQVHADCMLIAC